MGSGEGGRQAAETIENKHLRSFQEGMSQLGYVPVPVHTCARVSVSMSEFTSPRYINDHQSAQLEYNILKRKQNRSSCS